MRAQLLNMVRAAAAQFRPWPRVRASETLAQVCAQLEGFAQDTEQDFLRVGAKLEDLNERALRITQQASELVEAVGGTEGEDASRAVGAVMDRLQKGAGGDQQRQRFLASAELEVHSLQGALGNLEQSSRVIDVLAVLILIESSRTEAAGAGFDTVAHDVAALGSDIRRGAEEVLDGIRMLADPVGAATGASRRLEVWCSSELAEVERGCRQHLNALAKQRHMAAASSQLLAAEARTVAERMAELVTSIQFHDITRQRLEHVSAAAREIDERLKGRPRHGDFAAAAEIAELQAAQLRASAQTIETAIQRIVANLGEIELSLQTAGQQASATRGSSGGDGPLLGEATTVLSVVADRWKEFEASERLAGEAASGVLDAIHRLEDQVARIEGVSIRMQRVALNAAVKAAHLGERGRALGTLAIQVQEATHAAAARSETVAGSIRELGAVASHQQNTDESRPTALSGDLASVSNALALTTENYERMAEETRAQAGTLAREIDSLRQSICSPEQVRRVLGGAAEEFERIASECRRRAPQLRTPENSILNHLEERYTMAAERQVQATVTAGKPIPVDEFGEDDELGENVEFF